MNPMNEPMTLEQLSEMMEQLTEQNLQIALVFEKIVNELKTHDDEGAGLMRMLAGLLRPLVASSEQILNHLGIPPTKP